MAFRADEAAQNGFDEAQNYLVKARDVGEEIAERSRKKLQEIVDELGPVVAAYPSWHPLVRAHDDPHSPPTSPSDRCGYVGLDHTRLFVNGFITCPYDDGQRVIDSVNALPQHHAYEITAERLKGVVFYNKNATPILVRCRWKRSLHVGTNIPTATALPMLLETELPTWEWAQVAETWETMRPYFLGRPHGAKSSLFVTQETGQAMKSVWETMIQTGMFGPIRAK